MKRIISSLQSSHRRLDLVTKVGSGTGVSTGHHGQLARGVIDENGSKAVAASNFLNGGLGGLVAGSVLGGVDLLQLVVAVADKVIDKEDSGVCVGRLALGVRFEGAVLISTCTLI